MEATVDDKSVRPFVERASSPARFQFHRAERLALACAAAYQTRPEFAGLGFASAEPFSTGTAGGYVARHEQDVVLIFRGTDTPTDEGNRCLLQWLVNCDFGQVDGFGGRVHKGFAAATDHVWGLVHSQVRSALVKGGRLWVAGHSMGGALAVLSAARLVEESVPVAGVYTFGTPRVGDAAFAASYRPSLHCIENANDIVCHLPPPPAAMQVVGAMLKWLADCNLNWSMPSDVSYEDVGALTFIDWDGQVRASVPAGERVVLAASRLFRFARMVWMPGDRASLLDDHRITAYVERLGNASTKADG
jgi:hypothetical protein